MRHDIYVGDRDHVDASTTRFDDPGVVVPISFVRLIRELSGRRTAPFIRPSDLDLDLIVRAGLFGYTHEVDVSGEDPLGFSFSMPSFNARSRQIWQPQLRVVRDIAGQALQQSVADIYQAAKSTREPLLSHVRFRCDRLSYESDYRRLILPMASDGATVDRLLVAIGMVHPVYGRPSRLPATPLRTAEANDVDVQAVLDRARTLEPGRKP